MADTNQLAVVHTCSDGIKRTFLAPSGLTVSQLQALSSIDPEKDGWVVVGLAPTDGSAPAGFSTDCGQTVVPPAGNVPPPPTWNLVALNAKKPPLIAGTYFEWSFKMSEVATAGAGAALSGIRTPSRPAYLDIVQQNGVYRIYGNVPADLNYDEGIDLVVSETYTIGDLSSGSETKTTVSLPIVSGDFYCNYEVNENSFIMHTGPNGGTGNIPYVTFTQPDGTVRDRVQMDVFGIAPVDGYAYLYRTIVPKPMPGIWQFKEEFLGKVKYGTFVVPSQPKDFTGIGLTDSPSAPPPTVTPKITAMDWYWQFRERQANTVGATTIYTYLGNYYVLFNVSNGATPEFWANISTDGANAFPGFKKFDLQKLTNDAKGYTHVWTINSAAKVKTYFKVKIAGADDSTFIYFDLTMPAPPAATTTRVGFYPTADTSGGGGGSGSSGSTTTSDLTTLGNFAGTKSGGYRSTDTNMLNMGYTFTGGRIRNLVNNAAPAVQGGFAERYLINDRWYAFNRDNKQWYKVATDGSIAGQATTLSFGPQLGVLIQMFIVDLSRPMNGSGRDNKGWRDDGVSNASQILRIQ